MENIIEIKKLCKSFGDIKAVRELDLTVRRGELFAFLGVNGAGKSTTINMICASLRPDSGSIVIDGEDVVNDANGVKTKIGVVFQNSLLDKSLNVRDNLESRAALYGIVGEDFRNRLTHLAKLLEFENLLSRTVGKLSGGQRRRIDIARALIHSPKILILDEPTTGLDPQTRKTLWRVIGDLRERENMTVFLTTHYMEEAADADYVIIIDSGRLIAEGTPIDLKNKFTKDYITLYNADEDKVKKLGIDYERLPDAFRISVKSTSEATALILKFPELFVDYEIVKGKMDDVFLNATGRSLEINEEASNK